MDEEYQPIAGIKSDESFFSTISNDKDKATHVEKNIGSQKKNRKVMVIDNKHFS